VGMEWDLGIGPGFLEDHGLRQRVAPSVGPIRVTPTARRGPAAALLMLGILFRDRHSAP
jgi:hypothetical protein